MISDVICTLLPPAKNNTGGTFEILVWIANFLKHRLTELVEFCKM